jgi:hypothetical protein
VRDVALEDWLSLNVVSEESEADYDRPIDEDCGREEKSVRSLEEEGVLDDYVTGR